LAQALPAAPPSPRCC